MPKPKKPKMVTVNLHIEVAELARDASVATGVTMTQLANDGVRGEVKRLQAERNGGRRFPKRARAVRKGRPVAG